MKKEVHDMSCKSLLYCQQIAASFFYALYWALLTSPVDSWMSLFYAVPSFRKVSAENSKLVVSNRRAVLEQEMKELSRGDVVEG